MTFHMTDHTFTDLIQKKSLQYTEYHLRLDQHKQLRKQMNTRDLFYFNLLLSNLKLGMYK